MCKDKYEARSFLGQAHTAYTQSVLALSGCKTIFCSAPREIYCGLI